MKILYKMLLFMILVNLVTILIGLLGVFPEGSIPMSDINIRDNHGDITAESIINFFGGQNTISFSIPGLSTLFPGLTSITISWGVILTIFTVTVILISVIIKNVQPFIIGLMALMMYTMYRSSITWFNNLSKNVGGVAYPSLIFIMTIIGFGILYVFLITLIESHLQGDVSDK